MMTYLIDLLNECGDGFCGFALMMLIQSSVLIGLLYGIDLVIRRRVRAVFRYGMWMLVLVKLMLPPGLCMPTGVGYWCGIDLPETSQKVVSQALPEPIKNQIPQAAMKQELGPLLPAPKQITSTEIEQTMPFETVQAEAQAAGSGQEAAGVCLRWQGGVFLLWLVGMLVLSVLLFQRLLFVRSLLAQSEPANERLDEVLQYSREKVGIRKKVQLRLAASMMSPAACGLRRPVILIPSPLLGKLSRGKLTAVLIHELAHIKRGDLWVHFAQTILQIVYFYHPLLWLANAKIRRVREKAVDEMVLTVLGDQADGYSRTLIDIAEAAFSRPHFSLRLVGVVESKKALRSRIQHILSRPFPKSAKLGLAGFLAITIIAAALLPMVKAANEDKSIASKYVKELENGVTVELMGVCEYPSKGKVWWRADGNRFDIPVETIDWSHYPTDEPGYEFVFKMNKSVGYRVQNIKGSNVGSDLTVLQPVNCIGRRAHIKKGRKSTNIEFAVESGEWETVLEIRGEGSESKQIKGKTLIVAAKVGEGKSTSISTSDELGYKQACRMVAFDDAGQQYVGHIATDTGIDNMRLRTFTFDMPSEQLSRFEFQMSPYITVEFKNVSLEPGFKTDAQSTVEKNVGQSEFKATFPNDVVVELVGVCEHPSKGKEWWRADGSELKQRPWEKINGSVSSVSGLKEYEFALKLNYPEDKAPGYYVMIGERGGRCSGSHQQSSTSELRWELVGLPENLETTDVHLAIASGPWEIQQKQKPFPGGVYCSSGVVWHAPIAQDDKTVLSVAHGFTKDQPRLVAIDKQGNEHIGGGNSGSINGDTLNAMVTFKVKLEEIEEFQIRTRPYEYRTFRNVSLKPGVRTDVEVIFEDAKTDADTDVAGQQSTDPALSEKQKQVQALDKLFGSLKAAYEEKDWGTVNTLAEGIRDVFRHNKESFIELFGQDQTELLEELSDELHDSVRDEKLYLAPAYYDQLIIAWEKSSTDDNSNNVEDMKSTIQVGKGTEANETKEPKWLKIVVYKGSQEPDVSLKLPLGTGLPMIAPMIPKEALQLLDDPDKLSSEYFPTPTTLLDVKEGNERVIISVE